MPFVAKLRLILRIWALYAQVRLRVDREPLPSLVGRWAVIGDSKRRGWHPPTRLSRAIYRSLRVGSRRPRCLVNALVLFRLLREQGDPAQLVIGLPDVARDQRAHAWVELYDRDIGPPPGRAGHREMARLP